jgi:ribosome recycling factor
LTEILTGSLRKCEISALISGDMVAEKNKVITQDMKVQGEEKISGLTNAFIKKVDEILAHKEKEILEI